MLTILVLVAFVSATLGGLGVIPFWPALLLALPGVAAMGWMSAP